MVVGEVMVRRSPPTTVRQWLGLLLALALIAILLMACSTTIPAQPNALAVGHINPACVLFCHSEYVIFRYDAPVNGASGAVTQNPNIALSLGGELHHDPEATALAAPMVMEGEPQ